MPPGHPLYDRIERFVRQARQMGFWTNQEKFYTDRRYLKSMIHRQRIIFNFEHGLNNTEAVQAFRDTFYDPMTNHTG